MAETGSVVEILRNRVRSSFQAQYCFVTAATATGLIKARSIRLHRDLDGQMYGSTLRPSDGRLVNPSPRSIATPAMPAPRRAVISAFAGE